MRHIITIIIAALAFASAAHAAPTPKVGPLDGTSTTALPALATPTANVEKLIDTAFPRMLENMHDFPSAALEWQRVAYKSQGPEREAALYRAAQLHMRMGHTAAAVASFRQILQEDPDSPHLPEALYYLSHLTTGATQTEILTGLQTKFPTSGWTKTALMENAWQQAATGRIEKTWSQPNAVTLQKRLQLLRKENQDRLAIAGAAGVVPGAGHIFLGQYAQGGFLLLGWAMFALAFLSACRHRHYAYAFVFAVPMAALWLSSPVVAMQQGRQQATEKLAKSLAEWKDVLPPAAPEPGA